jgi:hypothetical protein
MKTKTDAELAEEIDRAMATAGVRIWAKRDGSELLTGREVLNALDAGGIRFERPVPPESDDPR